MNRSLRIISYQSDDRYFWTILSGDLWVGNITYILKNNGKEISTIFEFALDIIEYPTAMKMIDSECGFMIRNISMDIKISLCLFDITRKIFECDIENIIVDIQIINAKLISKSNVSLVNYELRLIYHNTSKENIKALNDRIYKDLHFKGERI
jgi:hypothetical protein